MDATYFCGQCNIYVRLWSTETDALSLQVHCDLRIRLSRTKRTLYPNTCKMVIAACKTAVKNSHRRVKQSWTCKTVTVVRKNISLFLSVFPQQVQITCAKDSNKQFKSCCV